MKLKFFLLILFLNLVNIGWTQKQYNNHFKDNISDSLRLPEIGDLELLAQRVYEAFSIYTIGQSQANILNNLPVGTTDSKTYLQRKQSKYDDLPIILDATNEEKGEQCRPIDIAEMKASIDKIKSIEIIYDPKTMAALYGTKGMSCVMKIKFKGE